MKFNVFYLTFTNVFLFLSRFLRFLTFFYFDLNVFYIYDLNRCLLMSLTRCSSVGTDGYSSPFVRMGEATLTETLVDD